MGKPLVIVESPTKAKTISKFLDKGFVIKASYGHVRDLPNSATEIPAKIKSEKWTRIGVNVDDNFDPLYIVPPGKKKQVEELKQSLKDATELYLATDEDREGESISWHLLEVLKPKVPVKRLVFHEITKKAIQESLQNARGVDESLVKAQETRRIVDRLFGYMVSPLLWKKMAPRLSAGRVQSVAIRLLVERERARIAFRRAKYWDITAKFSKDGSAATTFDAELTHVDDKRVASGKDFEPNTGLLKDPDKVVHLDGERSQRLAADLQGKAAKVLTVEEKPYTSKPYPPFTTSTLQQEGSRKLGFAARRTMSVAQTLYEHGFITYMRTDSTTLSQEAIDAARNLIRSDFGAEYLPPAPREYKTKVRNAQEAHEAIRPAGSEFASPAEVQSKLGIEAFKLYEMIWKRTLASQMPDARGTRIGVTVQVGEARFRAAGKTIEFPGYLRAYVEGSDDPEADLADQEKILPKLAENESLRTELMAALEHETQPPGRYTEGSLIKELERLGIGRPSTWATIVGVVLSRTYAYKRGNTLVPTFLAAGVTGLMEGYFTHLLDYEFTARLEDDLDAIARGEADNIGYLKGFYFGNGFPGLQSLVTEGEEKIDPRQVCGIPIGKTDDGREIEVRIGRYGPFLSDGEHRAGIPDTIAPDELTLDKAVEMLAVAAKGPESIGTDPESGKPVFIKTGRFGPYVQLGEPEEGVKPKMVSLLPGMSAEEVTLEIALKLLSLPRTLGKNPDPENNNDVIAALGRYGPYLKCGSETRSIPPDEFTPIDITLSQALEVLKRPKRGRGATAAKPMKELGKHPTTEKELVIKSGRYGPYVTDGEINASLPRGQDPAEVTVEMAVHLLEARAVKIAEKGGETGKGKKKAAKKKASSKKKTSKKKADSATDEGESSKKSKKKVAKKKAADKKG